MATARREVFTTLSHLPHELDAGLGGRARIGLIVLATDHTIEHEWRLILGGIDGVALYQSRIWNDATITPETLRATRKTTAVRSARTSAATMTRAAPRSICTCRARMERA